MWFKSQFCTFLRCFLVNFAGFCAFGFINRHQVLFHHLTLENPFKILPHDLWNLYKICSRFMQRIAIEKIAVEVLEFLANFQGNFVLNNEIRLEVTNTRNSKYALNNELRRN